MVFFLFVALSPHDHRLGRRAVLYPSRNAQRYEEAGRHVLDALTLQNSDAVGDPRGGVTSDALWDSLESVCGKMGRADLMGACSQRDLDSECLSSRDYGAQGRWLTGLVQQVLEQSSRLRPWAVDGLERVMLRP